MTLKLKNLKNSSLELTQISSHKYDNLIKTYEDLLLTNIRGKRKNLENLIIITYLVENSSFLEILNEIKFKLEHNF